MSEAIEFVHSHNAQYPKLFSENRIAELADMYAVDAKVMSYGKPIIVGREAIKIYLQQERDAYEAVGVKYTTEEVHEFDNETILDRGKYVFLEGQQAIDEGKYVSVYKKIDGRYMAYIEIYNSDRS